MKKVRKSLALDVMDGSIMPKSKRKSIKHNIKVKIVWKKSAPKSSSGVHLISFVIFPPGRTRYSPSQRLVILQ